MNRTPRLVFYVLMAAAILAAPAAIIRKHERILDQGRAFKFRVQPVDPYDAFRGRYVSLGFTDLEARRPDSVDFEFGRDIHVLLEEGEDGFVKVAGLTNRPPEGVRDFATMQMGWHRDYTSGWVRLTPPFNQFFMNEKLAPEAERLVGGRAGATSVWAVVRVLNGKGVIEQLMFNGVPAADFIRNR